MRIHEERRETLSVTGHRAEECERAPPTRKYRELRQVRTGGRGDSVPGSGPDDTSEGCQTIEERPPEGNQGVYHWSPYNSTSQVVQ